MTAALSIALPYPPSLNRLWRHVRGRAKPYLAPRYQTWKRAADNEYMLHKREWKPVAGHFSAAVTLDEKRRRGDVDNRIKVVLDWLQRVELIENDKFCDAITIRWGHAPEGVRVLLCSNSLPVADARRAA